MSPKAPSASFLLRIWWEMRADPADPPLWRGRIEHVPSGRSEHFDGLDGLLGFIESWTGELSAGSAAITRNANKERPKGGT